METGTRDVSVGFTQRELPVGTHSCFAGFLAAGDEAGHDGARVSDEVVENPSFMQPEDYLRTYVDGH